MREKPRGHRHPNDPYLDEEVGKGLVYSALIWSAMIGLWLLIFLWPRS